MLTKHREVRKDKDGFKLQGARYKEGCKVQVTRCELQKTVYSIEYRVSSEEKIKMVASCE